MTAHFPDSPTLRTALALATRAPSGRNVQPWTWRVGTTSLHLHVDSTRQPADADPDGRDSMISCGATLNHCVVALAALGWHSKVHRFPNPSEPGHVAAIEVRRDGVNPVNGVDVTLAAAIPIRRTDRRYFSGWPVAHANIATMGMRAARMGIALRRIDPSTELRADVARAVWHDGTAAALSGPPRRATGDDHGVLLALGTIEDDGLARLRAGEATSLVLLTATSMGMATCAVTKALEFSETREAIRSDAFDGDQFPQMLVRVGWPPVNADPLPATPRRPLTEVVARLDGSRWE